MITIFLIILLLFLLVGALPVYPYSREWGYSPGISLLGLLIIVLLVLWFTGYLPAPHR